MNIIISILLSIMMGVSITPSNPNIVAFIEESNKIDDPTQYTTYEKTQIGEAVVLTQLVDAPSEYLDGITASDAAVLKSEFLKGMKSEPSTAMFLNILKDENVNFILRMKSTIDNNFIDFIFRPSDF